jgi:MFS family permease
VRGRPKDYDPDKLLPPLKVIWLAALQPCGERLKAALPDWLPAYEADHRRLDADVRQALLAASRATLDRLAIGFASNLSPMYIAEIAPAAIRGKLVSLYQFNIVIGIVVAQVANWLIAKPVAADATPLDILNSWNGQSGWRWMFCLVAVPAFLFLLGLLFVPESPRWLVKKGRREQAKNILTRLGGEPFAVQAVADVESTRARETGKMNFGDLFAPGVRRIVGFGVLLAFIVQWSGINVIFYYTKDVFAAAGYDVSAILLNIIIVGATNLIFTLVALQTVDKLGRRWLTLAGWAGLTLVFLAMGWCFHAKVTGLPVVILVMVAIGWYAMTIAPMCWVPDYAERSTPVYFPRGTWVDYWTGKEYVAASNQWVNCTFPSWSGGPLFARSGAIIPTTSVKHYTEERPDELITLDVYPDTTAKQHRLYEDDGITFGYEKGEFANTEFSVVRSGNDITVDLGKREGNYPGKPAARDYLLKVHSLFAPALVRVDGRELPAASKAGVLFDGARAGWYFDAAMSKIIIKPRAGWHYAASGKNPAGTYPLTPAEEAVTFTQKSDASAQASRIEITLNPDVAARVGGALRPVHPALRALGH